jgi:hypothetical protein
MTTTPARGTELLKLTADVSERLLDEPAGDDIVRATRDRLITELRHALAEHGVTADAGDVELRITVEASYRLAGERRAAP